MKKLLQNYVLTAFSILALSFFFVNLNGQVKVIFANDSADIGTSTTGGLQPLTLNFKINNVGKISLDAFTENKDSLVMSIVNGWDSDSVGNTNVASLFGYSFSLVATSRNDRLQCGYSATGAQGGLGISGKQQRRIDDKGTEFLDFELKGEVGLDFTSIAYSDVNNGIGNIANLRFIDYDSDKTYFITQPVLTIDSVFNLPDGEIKMRNSLDTLTVTTSDTILTSDGNEGARLYGIEFNVVEPEPKPLPVGQIALDFVNNTGLRTGNDATGSLEPLTLDFSIDAEGKISLDASTGNVNPDVMTVVNSWDSDSLGITDKSTLFNKSFSLMVTSNARIQCDAQDGNGGLGVQGRNQWRIDDKGIEKLFFVLKGDAGLEFVSFKYNSLNSGTGDAGNLRFIDYNSDNTYILKKPGLIPFSEYALAEGDVQMRYKTDSLTVTTSDTITSDGNEGARLYGFVLNVVEPIIKPPAIVSTTPAAGDTSVLITTDYVIEFDTEIDKTTASAITITPEVANRTNTWNEAGDKLTISFDDLNYFTNYTVTVGTDLKGTNSLNVLDAVNLSFRTRPTPPIVIFTYPSDKATSIPVNTPLTIEFSQSMDISTVENAVSFDPELAVQSFSWNKVRTKAYLVVDEMSNGETYKGTINTVAADIYSTPLVEPFEFQFTIVNAVSVEGNKIKDVVLYPNPATDILQISGMDVVSIKIYSITGGLVKEAHNSASINVSDIKPGSYIVAVSDKDNNAVRKLILIE